jgi:hypothetical protein
VSQGGSTGTEVGGGTSRAWWKAAQLTVEVRRRWGGEEAPGRRCSPMRLPVRWSPAEGGGPAARDKAQRGEVRLKFKEGT